jgi:hypothetical protein
MLGLRYQPQPRSVAPMPKKTVFMWKKTHGKQALTKEQVSFTTQEK